MDIFQKELDTGYYLLTIRSGSPGLLLATNSERAFIIAQLQDLLSTRVAFQAQAPHYSLATHVDLLAFSVLKEGIQLLLFSISGLALRDLTTTLTHSLQNYKDRYAYGKAAQLNPLPPITSIQKLIGPHDALKTSLKIHLNHTDWESDRYSSIGFYLHDRRGDWMRLWRLSHLYEKQTLNYYRLMQLARKDFKLEPQTDAPLHANLAF